MTRRTICVLGLGYIGLPTASFLATKGYEVLGVSTDSEKSHQKFIAKERLPFRLLSDSDKSVHTLYGTWVEKSLYGRKYMGTARKTFVIDEKGNIEYIIDKVDTRDHAAQILGFHGGFLVG